MDKLIAILSLCAFALTLTSCGKEDKPRYDPDAPIWINGRDNPANKSATTKQKRLTVAEICAGDSIILIGRLNRGSGTGIPFMINPTQPAYGRIDVENSRLPLRAENIDVLENNTFLHPNIKWYIAKTYNDSGYLGEGDTIAYVPTSNRLAAAEALRPLFDPANGGRDANLDAIYKIFNEAFIFVPCTGEEYKELVAADLD